MTRSTPQELLTLGVGYAAYSQRLSVAPLEPERLDEILVAFGHRSGVVARFLRGGVIDFEGLCDLRETMRRLDGRPVIIATMDLGSLQMSAVALRHCGLQIITPYRGISAQFEDVSDKIRSVLVDLNVQGSGRMLARTMTRAQDDGLMPFLLVEAPGRSQRRHDFLGYLVQCSRFLCWFAALSGSVAVLIWNEVRADNHIRLRHRVLERLEVDDTPRMLAAVQDEIVLDPAQYAWEFCATLFSDPQAGRAALSCLPDLLAWRERVIGREI